MSRPGRELAPGTSLGPFQVLSRLGRGAMGTVYRARDRAGTEVALKVMNDDESRDPEFIERFRRESAAAASVKNPFVVHCVGSGDTPSGAYMALELVTGGTLADRLHRVDRLSWREAVKVATEIAIALEAVHAAGLVHRDLKPQNVLLDAEGRCKLADFGIARGIAEANKLTKTGELLGTAEYMAPEQAGSPRDIDGRADLYALGITIHALIAGVPPFRGTVLSIVKRKLTEPPPRLRTIDPRVPASLDALVASLLMADPVARPRDARTVREALEATLREKDPAPGWVRFVVAGVVAFVVAVAFVVHELAPQDVYVPPTIVHSTGGTSVPGPRWYREISDPTAKPAYPLPPGVRFSEPPEKGLYELERDHTVKLVFVPAGEFSMGNPDKETDELDAQPEHTVALSPYFIGRTEVTVEQFRRFMESPDHPPLQFTPGGGMNPKDPRDDRLRWDHPFLDEPVREDEPVVQLLPEHALAYAAWARAALPTEAQWERAASWDASPTCDPGKRKRRFAWGDELPKGHTPFANLIDTSYAQRTGQNVVFVETEYTDDYPLLAPVMKFPKDVSPVGAYDMTGNVCEICRDFYDEGYYKKCAKDPVTRDPLNRIEVEKGVHVQRGGSWGAHTKRIALQIRLRTKGERPYAGFRVAVDTVEPR